MGGHVWQELTAQGALGLAVRQGSVPELQAALMAARAAMVSSERLEEAELQLGRMEIREALLLAMSGSEAELREALENARAMALEPPLLASAEARLQQLVAEQELRSTLELLTSLDDHLDEETSVAFTCAVREAEAAGVQGPCLQEAQARLARLVPRKRRPEAPAGEVKRPKLEGDPLERWARCILESTLLACCKRKAIEAEEGWGVLENQWRIN